MVLIGGYYQDPSHAVAATFDPSIIAPPEVTAADVVDRETLRAFVRGTVESYFNALEEFGIDELLPHQDIFREEGGPWRDGSIYFFLFTTEGHVIFHGADRARELRDAIPFEDVNGVKVTQELIKLAQGGRRLPRVYYDDPAVTGDEDIGSPKVGYAELFTFQGREYVLGAGFYTGDPDRALRTRLPVRKWRSRSWATPSRGWHRRVFPRHLRPPANYAWNAFTDADGQVSLTISSTRRVSGFYQARARDAVGGSSASGTAFPSTRTGATSWN